MSNKYIFIQDCVSNRQSAAKYGHTLLEIIIAMTITVVLTGSIIGAWISYAQFQFGVDKNLETLRSLTAVRTTLSDEFRKTSNFSPFDVDDIGNIKDSKNYAKMHIIEDKTTTPSNLVDVPVIQYPEVASDGREIQYVRLRTTLIPLPKATDQRLYFTNLGKTNAIRLNDFGASRATTSIILNTAAGDPDLWNISPVWDSDLTNLNFVDNSNPKKLRIYRYVLLPYSSTVPSTTGQLPAATKNNYPAYSASNPTLLRGMLVCQYANASSATFTTIGPPLCDTIIFNDGNTINSAHNFKFSTADHNSIISNAESIFPENNEIRLSLSIAQETSRNGPLIIRDIRLSFYMRRAEYGQ